MLFFYYDAFVQKAIGLHVLIINHLIYYVNKRTLDVTVRPGLLCVCVLLVVNLTLVLKVFRVKLQLLFDPVLHQQTEVGVCHWNTVTHKHLLFGLLRCKTDKIFFAQTKCVLLCKITQQ